jgi:transposase InsO family protein
MKKRFTELQIVGFLREADGGVAVKDVCREHGFSEGSYYLWRSKFGGMSVSDAKRRCAVDAARRSRSPRAPRSSRPTLPNDVWSADLVFDRTAEGRVLKCLTIVDDATTEAVAVVPARALGGLPVTRVLDRLALERGLPRGLRTDNALEFCGRRGRSGDAEDAATSRALRRVVGRTTRFYRPPGRGMRV